MRASIYLAGTDSAEHACSGRSAWQAHHKGVDGVPPLPLKAIEDCGPGAQAQQRADPASRAMTLLAGNLLKNRIASHSIRSIPHKGLFCS